MHPLAAGPTRDDGHHGGDVAPAASDELEPRPRRLRIDGWAATLAVVLSAFSVLGASYAAGDNAEWFAGSAGTLIGSLFAIALLATLLYVGLAALFRLLDRSWDRGPRDIVVPMRAAVCSWMWPSLGLILAGWLPWLIIHYPGAVDSDTITQRIEWLGMSPAKNHHPWFDTTVFGWFWDLGDALGSPNLGLFAYLLVQEVATAAGIALGIAYLARVGLPRGLRWALTLIAATFPAFVIAPSVMSKDAFAIIFWMPALILFVEIVRTRGAVLTRRWVIVVAVVIVIPLVLAKRTNGYLLLICVVVLAFVVARRIRWRMLAGAAAMLIVTNVVWPMAVLPALGVASATSADMMTIPVQQTARIVAEHGDEIPADEREAIDAMLRYDGLAEAYVPRRSDNVKARWNADAPLEQKLDYLGVWLAQVVRYPGTALSATAANTFEYFAPVTSVSLQRTLELDRYVDHWADKTYDEFSREDVEAVTIDALGSPAALDDARATTNALYTTFSEGNPLMSKALFSSWIPLIALAYALRRRSVLHVIATVPLFVNLAFLIAGPIALGRYLLPSIIATVFAVGLMAIPVSRTRPDRRGSA